MCTDRNKDRKRKKIVLKRGMKMASAVIQKKETDYRDSLKLTKEKREILKKSIGSVSSKVDFNKVRDYLKYGDYWF